MRVGPLPDPAPAQLVHPAHQPAHRLQQQEQHERRAKRRRRQRSRTSTPPPRWAIAPAGSSNTNDSPANKSPNENFAGVEGSRGPSRTHSHANTPESRITNSGWMATNQLEGTVHPSTVRSAYRSTNRFKVDAACS